MEDYIVRATAADKQIRAFAITSKNLVDEARRIHHASPVITAALGRLLTGGAMMGTMMKGDKDLLTLQMKGDGPSGGILVTADSHGNVKGYAGNPEIELPLNHLGKLDVGAAIGYGELTVIKDLGMKEPYTSKTALTTSEVAEDLTYYFAVSEQVPSAVALGVLVDRNYTVRQAGGFIIQLMPFAADEVVDKLEKKINEVTSVTNMLEQGMTPEQILKTVLADFGDVEFTDRLPCRYQCNCSRERMERALISLGRRELNAMIAEGKSIETNCYFCNSHYCFSVENLRALLEEC